MTYYVIDPSGTAYGPADERLLQQWAQEGRVLPSSTVRDANGQTMMATAVPGLFPGSAGQPGASPYGANPYAAQQLPAQPSGYYPRPAMAAGGNEVVISYVLSGLGVVMSPCVCALVGFPCAIGGLVLAKRASSGGDPRAPSAIVTAYAAMGVSGLFLVFQVFSLVSLRM